MSFPAARSRPRFAARLPVARGGFTLFEMVLVLAVLVLVASLSWPALSALYRHHQLTQGAELLKVRLGSARVYALETGLTYQFRYEPGGRRFILVPFDPEPPATSGSAAPRARRTAGMLPEGVTFEGGDTYSDQGTAVPDEWLAGLPDPAEYTTANYSQPVLFYPDGTAVPFDLVVSGRDKHQLQLTLRGLTGAVTVSGVGEGGG